MQKLCVFVDDGENRSLTEGELISGENGRVHIRTHIGKTAFELDFVDKRSSPVLTVKRNGEHRYEMSFIGGTVGSAKISTPYGKIDMDYETHSLECGCDDKSLRYEFKIHYTVCGDRNRYLTIIAAKSKEDL